jgi:hypothetical protein
VGWITGGEWLHYTADVVAGTYDISARVASANPNPGDLRLLIGDGTEFTELGTFAVETTGGWDDWTTVNLSGIDLGSHAGTDQVLRLEMVGGNFNVNWIEFDSSLDFGDAPESYGTLLADDGARHVATGPQLGATRDSESDGAPIAGDGSDEDGVMFGAIGAGSAGAAVNIEVVGGPASVDAWIDFDGSGTFDASEKILESVVVNQSMQTLNFDLPSDLVTGNYHARVRLSSAGGLGPTGPANDGEVEDYVVSVVAPPSVESVVFNGGEEQRSSLHSVRVTFDGLVDIDTSNGSPFGFSPLGSSDVIATAAPIIGEDDGKTVVDLTFVSGDPHVTSFGSLKDGVYQLKIDASRVTSDGAWLAGNGGSAADPYTTAPVDDFYRTYGDADGDGGVGLADFAIFRGAFGTSNGESGYFAGLDSDGSRGIGLPDFAAFRSNFGK